MSSIKARHLFFAFSLVLAIWFAITAWVWTYLANLILSFPAGLLSLLFWYLGRKNDPNRNRYRWIVVTWGIGLLFSMLMLVYLLWLE